MVFPPQKKKIVGRFSSLPPMPPPPPRKRIFLCFYCRLAVSDIRRGQESTPNMTRQRFHCTMEVIPALAWKSESLSVSRPSQLSVCVYIYTHINKGTHEVQARYHAEFPPLISIVRCPGRPVISVPETNEH